MRLWWHRGSCLSDTQPVFYQRTPGQGMGIGLGRGRDWALKPDLCPSQREYIPIMLMR